MEHPRGVEGIMGVSPGALLGPLLLIPVLKPFNALVGITPRHGKKHFLWLHCSGRATAQLGGVTSTGSLPVCSFRAAVWQLGWACASVASGSTHCLLWTLFVFPWGLCPDFESHSITCPSLPLWKPYPMSSSFPSPFASSVPPPAIHLPREQWSLSFIFRYLIRTRCSILYLLFFGVSPESDHTPCTVSEWVCLAPPVLCAQVSASAFSVLEQLTPALSRILWRLEPNFQTWLVYCNILTW